MLNKFSIFSHQTVQNPLTEPLSGRGKNRFLNVGKRFGFTLAEILITLGIIGVVAAMTLPTLMSNVKKTIYVNQLKVAYSTMQEGFKRMMADEQTTEFAGTELYSIGNITEDNASAVVAILSKYFKIASFEFYKSPQGDCEERIKKGYSHQFLNTTDNVLGCPYLFDNLKIVLTNGITMHFGNYWGSGPLGMYVDTNGLSGPNVLGRDWFYFVLYSNGKFEPYGGPSEREDDLESMKRSIIGDCSFDPNSYDAEIGNLCAARIIYVDNWQMKY